MSSFTAPPPLTVIPWTAYDPFLKQVLLNCNNVLPANKELARLVALGPVLYHNIYDNADVIAPEHVAPVDPGAPPPLVNGAGGVVGDRLYDRWKMDKYTFLTYKAAEAALHANICALCPPTIEQTLGNVHTGLSNVPMPIIINEVKRLYHQRASARDLANNKAIMMKPYDSTTVLFVDFVAEKKEAFKFAAQHDDAQTEQSKIAYFESSIRQVGVTTFDHAIQQYNDAAVGGLVPNFDNFVMRMLEADKFHRPKLPGTIAFGNGVANAATVGHAGSKATSMAEEIAAIVDTLLSARMANMAAAAQPALARSARRNSLEIPAICCVCGAHFKAPTQRIAETKRCQPCYNRIRDAKAATKEADDEARRQGKKGKP
jgi:hypothetical protein